mmetsp:Transcript_16891/g.33620  ORF Transcript_16891/g.33620 Transcript_16891/m.33620 type:complete len:374 (+) Transcript_16891:399-1520(+)|eukprot:CAMPEP_0194325094 /NCGR_PEP_ID=MMETSP0171-20130528/29036_1 /TAXON_ID=218684 /ORGANISM="Corethron pennatum, Strain L29A3" /LENGTH=373 /DNA_ID=CAMNT_0039084119 /DNA_START=379 /DNA_END=1500 /DNA_ORIENTATION=-
MQSLFDSFTRCLTGAGGDSRYDFDGRGMPKREEKESGLMARLRKESISPTSQFLPPLKALRKDLLPENERNNNSDRNNDRREQKSSPPVRKIAHKNTIFRGNESKNPPTPPSSSGDRSGSNRQKSKSQSPPHTTAATCAGGSQEQPESRNTSKRSPQHHHTHTTAASDDVIANGASKLAVSINDSASVCSNASSAVCYMNESAVDVKNGTSFLPLYPDYKIENQDWKRNALLGVKNTAADLNFNSYSLGCTNEQSNSSSDPTKCLFDAADLDTVPESSVVYQQSWDYDVETDQLVLKTSEQQRQRRQRTAEENNTCSSAPKITTTLQKELSYESLPGAELTGSSSSSSSGLQKIDNKPAGRTRRKYAFEPDMV